MWQTVTVACFNVWREIVRNVTTLWLVQIVDALTGLQNRVLRYDKWLTVLLAPSPSCFWLAQSLQFLALNVRTKANKGICSCLRGRGNCLFAPVGKSMEFSGRLQSVCPWCCVSSQGRIAHTVMSLDRTALRKWFICVCEEVRKCP